jgi:hypothetical protein
LLWDRRLRRFNGCGCVMRCSLDPFEVLTEFHSPAPPGTSSAATRPHAIQPDGRPYLPQIWCHFCRCGPNQLNAAAARRGASVSGHARMSKLRLLTALQECHQHFCRSCRKGPEPQNANKWRYLQVFYKPQHFLSHRQKSTRYHEEARFIRNGDQR